MSEKRTALDDLAEGLSRYDTELEASKAQASELSDAIKAALSDDPDWRRLCVDALAKAEGRTT